MECNICPVLLLILTLGSVQARNRFFISAPNVFHAGVKETVFVQMGEPLSSPVTLYLENQGNGRLLSKRITITCTKDEPIQTVELMIDREKMSEAELPRVKSIYPYILLVAESPSFSTRRQTRVLVSQHRGYIFIQTNQPIYTPTQNVMYRIFTLDHTLRPHEESFQISIINAAGNTIMKSFKTAMGGIWSHYFIIPDVSEMGTWRIVAHYEGDEAHAAIREFKVQKFVLPSFEVTIRMEQSYLLLNAPNLSFTISALYSYGEKVRGAYHCRFGVVTKGAKDGQKMKPVFIRGLELTGSVQDGTATAILQTAELNKTLQDWTNGQTLSDLEQSGAELYLAVSVTNIQSGELQDAEASIPIISHIYTIDLSQTRSHFIPGVPLDVVVVIRLPDGSPAAGVPVEIHVPTATSKEKSSQASTNQQGAVFAVFNILDAEVTVEVSVDGQAETKVIQRASSPSDCFLYLSFTNKIYSVGDSLTVTYRAINGQPNRLIYYMIFSRGRLIKKGSLRAGTIETKDNLLITPDMVPSFRLIGYYYNQGGDIIADSVWVDVRDECEKKVEVSSKKHEYYPGRKGATAELQFNLHGQKAKVALLAVDKAIYALNADNKLTAKQVFSSMQSYDLGCSYGGGNDTTSTLNDAGLSFISESTQSVIREGLGCHSNSRRQRRSLDVQQEMMFIKSNFSGETLQECCVRGFSLLPMRRTCEERAQRISSLETEPLCAEAFLQCCRQGERLRQRQRQEDAKKGVGRTANALEMEEFFSDTSVYIRRFFPPSFEFKTFDINGKGSHLLPLPDSITTWEIQAISLSATHGFCVAEPYEFRTFKKVFVSLRLPYSVKKYEQIAIEPVIYNYGVDNVTLAVHMEQTKGLCSPGSATSTAFVNITVKPQSSTFVSFSAVPMETGPIPIKIRIYNIEESLGIDSIEKTLNVWTEGIVQRVEETHVVKLDGRSTNSLIIDGHLPDNTVPDSTSNIFSQLEGDGFSESTALRLLSPEGVAALLKLPGGCGEQTMKMLAPTMLALRYFDSNQQWSELPVTTKDVALQYAEEGYMRILTFKKADGSYGAWTHWPSSTWLTGLVVKVLSLLAERNSQFSGQQGRQAKVVSEDEISHSVRYLLSVQNADGSFTDPHPVIHNEMQGGIRGKDKEASMTAFITIALNRSLKFLKGEEQDNAKASILKSTRYLLSHLEELNDSYAVAMTTYCLSICLPKEDASSAWMKLEGLATLGKDGCHMWRANAEEVVDAITVETTAYALLAGVALEKSAWAESTACWLTSQENYGGGFKSTQDTIVALEALSEYELKKPSMATTRVTAHFTVPGGRSEKVELSLENRKEKVEKDLKKLTGNNINVLFTGQGEVKLKVVKAYHLLEPTDKCEQLSINVNVEGKVKYTAKIVEDYDYYDEDYNNDEANEGRVPRSAIEWFDARTRYRRDADPSPNSGNTVSYEVCVSYSLSRNLTGMAIADITLLSGFEAVTENLDTLKSPPEQYISHYEISYGRVLIYFNKLERDACIVFDAIQRVPVGLLQPAPASFYDYYEPNRKCTVFYSAPQRSKMVSKLCSGDVCQCAERPCHKIKSVFEPINGRKITLEDRSSHACFFPIADYGYVVEVVDVSVKSNFELYTTNVTEVLRARGDMHVNVNDIRVFVKRLQCKGQLQKGKGYLILGKDGTTTDSNGKMQYLLESNTWVEQMPDQRKCKVNRYIRACNALDAFLSDHMTNGCRQ